MPFKNKNKQKNSSLMQNPYVASYPSSFFIQQHMMTSQLTYNQSIYQNRQHRNSLQNNTQSKMVTTSRPNRQSSQNSKTRQASEQKTTAKMEMANPIFTHSQVIYGNGQTKFNMDNSNNTPITLNSFQEMNIKIKDFPIKINEDPFEHQSPNSRSQSPNKMQLHQKQTNHLNQEWSDIIEKTKCLEQNLLILRNSVDKNLMKINRNKIEKNGSHHKDQQKNPLNPQSLPQNQSVKAMKNRTDTYTQLVNQIHSENADRFSKESISSKSTNNQSERLNFYPYEMKLFNQNTKSIFKHPPKTKTQHYQLPRQRQQNEIRIIFSQTNSSFSNKSFGGKIPKSPEQVNSFFSKDRNISNSEWSGESNVVKVQMPSRLNSPIQSKLSKEALASKSNFQNSERDKSSEKQQQQNLTLSRIRFDIPKPSKNNNFSNTSSGWYKDKANPFASIELRLKIKVGRFLGRGKFSDVYLARDQQSSFIFALKIIKKEIVAQFEMEEQIGREIRTQRILDHPNIVKMYGCDYDKKHIYLLLEYCEQGELFQYQNKQEKRRFKEDQASNYIFQILNAIQYMHDNQVMHRDLKTENILLSFVITLLLLIKKNQIKLCDLGCVSDFADRRTTFCGTIDYIAPEVITGGENECDVWQIAVLAYELVAGKAPFTNDGPRDEDSIMENIIKKEVSMPNYFSNELISFLKGGLQKMPDDRASMHQMIRHRWITKYNHDQQESFISTLKKMQMEKY